MRKTLSLVVGSSLLLQFAPLLVLARTGGTPPEKRDATRQEIQEKRGQLRQDVREKRSAVKTEVKQRAETLRQEFRDKAEMLRQASPEEREAFRKEFKEKREVFKTEVKEKREVFREEAKKRLVEFKKHVGEKRAENIERFFGNMIKKFEAAIDRLNQFANQIEERINKAEDNGKDVGAIRSELESARVKIADAESVLDDTKTKYSEAVANVDPKVAFDGVRAAVKGVTQKMKDAHQALVRVVVSLKGIGGGESEPKPVSEPTPAPAPEPTPAPTQ